MAQNTLSFVVLSLAVTLLLPNTAYSLVDNDEPFDSTQIPVEMQGWWAPNFGHVHAGLRLPLGQIVSGTLDLDVRVVMHNNPGHLTSVRICAESSDCVRKKVDLRCPYDGKTHNACAFNIPFALDTTQMKDGWRELRISANVKEPDGSRFFNSSGIPVNVQNGGSDRNYNRFCDNTSLIGRGWYEGFDYTNAIIECVPLEPLSGKHTFRVRAQKASGHLTVALDKTHFIPAVGPYPEQQHSNGQILFNKDGNFQSWQNITIDTSKLADGWHTLAVTSINPGGATSGCSFCKGELNHAAGVAKIWFFTDNGNPTNPGSDPEPKLDPDPVDPNPVDPDPVDPNPVTPDPVDPIGDPKGLDPTIVDQIVTHKESQSGGSANQLAVTTSAQITGINEDLYLAAISTRPSKSPVKAVSGLGLTWTRVEVQCSGRNVTQIEVWMAQGAPSNDDKVTATFELAPVNAALVVSRYSNVDPIDPIGQIVSGNTNGINETCAGGSDSDWYAFDLRTPIDGSVIYGAASMRNKSHQPGSGFTERAEVHHGTRGGDTTSVVVEDQIVSSPAPSTVPVRGSFRRNVDWAVIGLELKPQR